MSTSDQPSQSATLQPPCDIVMKGGITSGVVYPLALVELAKKYRFANIGGTSAGAIAAAAAAAAEYGRQTPDGGFDRLAKIPDEVGPNLLSMFQPTPKLKPLFNIFLAVLKGQGKAVPVITAAIGGYWPSVLFGLLPGVAVMVLAALFDCGAGFIAFGALLALVGAAWSLVRRLLKAANTDLVDNDFGLCPGIHQPPSAQPPSPEEEGFTDWLARLINEAAGRPAGSDPLTFGELASPPGGAPPIRLAMITTSLTEERPYTLPLEDDKRFIFRKDEWAKIFPDSIMRYLVRVCDKLDPAATDPQEFHFPDPARLPLIVGARMSLSFPGLIAGVPLWRRDFTLKDDAERKQYRRCLFSDGGLSSNFPIHFFDHLLPNSPTFAISLDDYDPKRNYDSVWLPEGAGSGVQLPVLPFSGLGGFLARLLFSAKDWQDNMQGTLPGYRERIAHVVLKPDEGGLNLTMSDATVKKLVGYGQQAGILLREKFDLDEHRWRRFLVAMARVEETLDEVATAYDQVPGRFGDFLNAYSPDPASYRQTAAEAAEMLSRGAELSAMGARWRTRPRIRDGKIPNPPTNLRITPKY